MSSTKNTIRIRNPFNHYMRLIHRYLGYFLIGIMAVYAISGIVMIFRETEFLKREKQMERQLAPNLQPQELGSQLRIRNLQVTKAEGNLIHFAQGNYDTQTGQAKYTVKELPTVLNKMTQLHKATTKHPLFFLNIFFGVSLLFFTISSLWMFERQTPVFKKGMYFMLGGFILMLIMLLI